MEKSLVETYFELPFDQFQRYRVLKDVAGQLRGTKRRLRILDVGGYLQTGGQSDFTPAQKFLPDDDVFVIDIKYRGPGKYVVGSGFALPFRAGSFDLAACMDTLEHIPGMHRRMFVQELKRVAENVLIVGPVKTDLTELAERILFSFIKTTLGVEHPALKEHLSFGLPSVDDIETWLSDTRHAIVQMPDGFLPNWLFMMLLKHVFYSVYKNDDYQKDLDRFYNSIFTKMDRREPSYRRMFLSVTREKYEAIQAFFDQSRSEEGVVSEAFGHTLANLALMNEVMKMDRRLSELFSREPSWLELMKLSEERLRLIEVKDELLQRQSFMISEFQKKLDALSRERDELSEAVQSLQAEKEKIESQLHEHVRAIEELNAFRNKVRSNPAYRLYRFLFRR